MGVSDALINFGCSAEKLSDSLMKAAECFGSLSSLPCRQTTDVTAVDVVLFSIVRKPVLKIDSIKSATLTLDSEKIDWDVIEEQLGLVPCTSKWW